VISDNSGYPVLIYLTYYDRSQGNSRHNFANIHINLTNQTERDIGNEIVSQLNAFLERKGKPHRFSTFLRYDNAIDIT
jgi:hypothetical protein